VWKRGLGVALPLRVRPLLFALGAAAVSLFGAAFVPACGAAGEEEMGEETGEDAYTT
jgi:hypothetical protein